MAQKAARKCTWCKHTPVQEREFCSSCGTYQATDGEFKDDGSDSKCILCGAKNQIGTFCSKCGRRLLYFRRQNGKLN